MGKLSTAQPGARRLEPRQSLDPQGPGEDGSLPGVRRTPGEAGSEWEAERATGHEEISEISSPPHGEGWWP